jgi:hypothetical protein
MGKRPSLAESLKAVERGSAPVALPPPAKEPSYVPQRQPREPSPRKPFRAATREGLKKVTTALAPVEHKKLKRLAVDHDKSVEDLLREAVQDLFAKYG